MTTFRPGYPAVDNVGSVAYIEASISTAEDVDRLCAPLGSCRHEQPYDVLRLVRVFGLLLPTPQMCDGSPHASGLPRMAWHERA